MNKQMLLIELNSIQRTYLATPPLPNPPRSIGTLLIRNRIPRLSRERAS